MGLYMVREPAAARRKSWARLILRVYEVDPLKLPGRSPPLLDDFCPDPFPDYGPQ